MLTRMDHRESDLDYPIVLTSWGGSPSRAAWVSATLCLIIGVAWTVVYWKVCVGPRVDCFAYAGVGPLGLIMAPAVWFFWKRGGRRGLELRIDREGFVVRSGRVPWDAVMSVAWRPDGTGGYIEVRVRNGTGYGVRDGRIQVDHRQYGVPANALIDAFEAAALPRRIPVLAIEPSPQTG